jgi:hypothetical protein
VEENSETVHRGDQANQPQYRPVKQKINVRIKRNFNVGVGRFTTEALAESQRREPTHLTTASATVATRSHVRLRGGCCYTYIYPPSLRTHSGFFNLYPSQNGTTKHKVLCSLGQREGGDIFRHPPSSSPARFSARFSLFFFERN